jgi:hypothetical protein
MFKQSVKKTSKSLEPPLTHPGGPPDSERAKQPPLPEPPYKPYTEKPAVHTPAYRPYAEKPAPSESPYEPYKGM